MRHILLTIDHEIFGSGAGDVRQHVVEPTERMARIADRHGLPLVIFFELEEYLAFEQFAGELRKDLGYDPAAAMREQVRDLVRRGHDVQLHLHPQWVGARYEQRRWRLHLDKLTVDDLFDTQAEVDDYIAARKRELERVVGLAPGDYSVCAYRAGGFAAQPGTKLLPALAKSGFVFESSVVHGLHRRSKFVTLDYRNAPARRRCWRVSQDVAAEDPAGPLLEIPIHSVMRRRLHQATFSRIKAKFSKNVPKDRQMEMIQELGIRWNPVSLARFLWSPVPIKMDFHNVAPSKLLRWIQGAPPSACAGDLDVLVLIGHSKEHVNDAAFEQLASGLARQQGTTVTTFGALAAAMTPQARADLPARRLTAVP